MAAQFINYWTPDTAARELERVDADPYANHAASGQFGRVHPGDVLWIVTAWPGGHLALLARVPVGAVTDPAGAAVLLGKDPGALYPAPFHVVAPDGAAEPMRNIDLSDVVADLRFESANDRLRVSGNGRIDPSQLQTMRRLTPATAELLEAVWRQAPGLEQEEPETELDRVEEPRYTETEYREALVRAESRISTLQRRMLVAHAEAPDLILSVRQLAAAAGYENPQVTYAQYGRLGYLLAEVLGHPHREAVWTRLIGDDWRTQDSAVVWEMHPQLAHALVALGWASRAGAPDVAADIASLSWSGVQGDEPGTTRDTLIAARVGQGPFRKALIRYWGSCAVTGVSEPAVLRASHIKPWRDSSDAERLDRYNGLLLAAHLDALFDAGLITFDPEGRISVSPLLAPEDRAELGITDGMRLRLVEPAHEVYLAHHRTDVFRTRPPR